MNLSPKLIIFDVDGVLVDVHGSFHQSIVDTVHFFTGHRPDHVEIHRWKNRSGYNDDWRLSTDWIASLGYQIPYEEVKRRFQKFYWGGRGRPGHVLKERWLVSLPRLERWSRRAELALFTGRSRRELNHSLKDKRIRRLFRRIVTIENVKKGKPHPEGLRILLDDYKAREAVYLGDNIDDALASRRARVPFLGVLPHGSEAHHFRAARLKELGALAVLHDVGELEKYWR